MGMAALELLVVLLVLLAGVAVVVRALTGGESASLPGPDPRVQLAGPDPVIERVRALAWDSREIDTPLADALIAHLNAHEHDPDHRGVRNQLGEIAWQHRETSPHLSVLVIDALRHPGA